MRGDFGLSYAYGSPIAPLIASSLARFLSDRSNCSRMPWIPRRRPLPAQGESPSPGRKAPNLEGLRRMAGCPVPLIASGGITRVEDLRQIRALGAMLIGAIVGRALYEGLMDLRAAMAAVA